MKILKRNVSKEEFKDFLNRIDLTDENLYKELSENQNFIFQLSGNTGSRMTAELKPTNFDDVVNLNAMSRPGSSYNFGNYVLIKNGEQKSPYPEQLQQFLKKSRGLINFQEEIMQIGSYLSPYKKEITITLQDGSKKVLKEDEIVETKNGKKRAIDLTEEDEIESFNK